MLVVVVRHGCAGDKQEWPGVDADRPLDQVGVRQADALAGVLAERPLRRLLSSPTRRCVDTLRPLARRTGLPIEPSAVLGLDASPEEVIALLTDREADRAVLCTHGEVMQHVLVWLRSLGVDVVGGDVSDDRLLRKGAGWSIDTDDGRLGLEPLAPTRLEACPEHPDRR